MQEFYIAEVKRFELDVEKEKFMQWSPNSSDINASEQSWAWDCHHLIWEDKLPDTLKRTVCMWEMTWEFIPQERINAWIKCILKVLQLIVEHEGDNDLQEYLSVYRSAFIMLWDFSKTLIMICLLIKNEECCRSCKNSHSSYTLYILFLFSLYFLVNQQFISFQDSSLYHTEYLFYSSVETSSLNLEDSKVTHWFRRH